MIYIVTLEDTVTYLRTIELTVEADSKEEAHRLAFDQVDDAMSEPNDTFEEQQIDNTPYVITATRALELYYMIEPSNEPRGQGNGWELCDEHKATCFWIRDKDGELYEGLETRQQAEEWIEDHPLND